MKDASRASMFVLKALAVLVAAVAVFSVAPGREAEAQAPILTGVYCMDLYTDGDSPETPKGVAHQPDDGIQPGALPETKIMTRIEPSSQPGWDWDMTSVSYRGPGGFFVTDPPTDDPCATKTDGNSLNVPSVPINLLNRPTNFANVNIKLSEKSLEWDICSFEDDLGLWVNTHWNVVVQIGPPFYGELLVDVGGAGICNTTASGTAERLIVEMYKRVATKGSPGAGADDWDSDGVSDWDELADPPPAGFCDPFTFNPPPCDVVGGVAELPEVTGAAAREGDSTGGGVNALVASAIALAAGATGIVAGVWYLRRRRADG